MLLLLHRTCASSLASDEPGRYVAVAAVAPTTGRDPQVLAGLGGDRGADTGHRGDDTTVPGCLGDVLAGLRAAVGEPALGRLDAEQLREVVAELTRVVGLATTAQARAVALLRRTGAVEADGASSPTAWVQDATGRSSREASRLTNLAGMLDELARTAAAVEAGAITEESADAIARAARDGRLGTPEQVDASLAPVAAGSTPEQLRRTIRRRTHVVDGASMLRDERRAHAARRVSLVDQPDGLTTLSGQLPRETSARLRSVLQAFDLPDDPSTPRELRRSHGQRLADALDAAATRLLAHGELPDVGGRVPRVTVHVDLATVQADLTAPSAGPPSADVDAPRAVATDDPVWATLPAGSLEWGEELSPQAVRRVLCDAEVVRVVTDGSSLPVDVGRATHVWNTAQRRRIAARARGCRGPRCDRPQPWTQIHHVQWWSLDGPTDMDNGVSLCHACHRLVHDHGWEVRLDHDAGGVRWTRPDGSALVDRAHSRPR